VLILVLTAMTALVTSGVIVGRYRWREISPVDERRVLGAEIAEELHGEFLRLLSWGRLRG
jgi:hypothetical protein